VTVLAVSLLVLAVWLVVARLVLAMMAVARHADDQAWRQHRRAGRSGET